MFKVLKNFSSLSTIPRLDDETITSLEPKESTIPRLNDETITSLEPKESTIPRLDDETITSLEPKEMESKEIVQCEQGIKNI